MRSPGCWGGGGSGERGKFRGDTHRGKRGERGEKMEEEKEEEREETQLAPLNRPTELSSC